MTRASLFTAADCHLCEPARAVARAVCGELGVTLEIVDITGDVDLETRYRPQLPVLEIDGVRAFKFYLDAEDLRSRLTAQT